MTTVDPSTPRPGRTRTLREDLLDDLRRAAPMPAVPPATVTSVPARPVRAVPAPPLAPPPAPAPTPAPGAAPAPAAERAGRPVPAAAGTPTLELRVTPKLWWGLRVRRLGDGAGLVLGAGPVQISLTGFRR